MQGCTRTSPACSGGGEVLAPHVRQGWKFALVNGVGAGDDGAFLCLAEDLVELAGLNHAGGK